MDAHFSEYLAAVVGMQELYGDGGDDHPTEFHEPHADIVAVAAQEQAATVGVA